MIFRAVISAVKADMWKLSGRGSLVRFLATEIESGVVISWFSSLFFSLTAFLTLSSLQQITTRATALPRKRVPPAMPRTQTVPHFAMSTPGKASSNVNIRIFGYIIFFFKDDFHLLRLWFSGGLLTLGCTWGGGTFGVTLTTFFCFLVLVMVVEVHWPNWLHVTTPLASSTPRPVFAFRFAGNDICAKKNFLLSKKWTLLSS